jgi:recombination protein RecT
MGRDLAKRASAATKRQTNGNRNTPAEQKTLGQQIEAMRDQFQIAMPKGAEAGQLIRDALTCVRTTKNLVACDAQSVLGGLMTCAQLGLRPGVGALGHAWLLPFWDRNRNDGQGGYAAQLVIGYQGWVDLCYRTERVLSIAARTRYENDYFELEYNLDGDKLIHRPCLDGPRGEPSLFYAVARLKDGGYAITDPMTVADMEAHRDRFAMTKSRKTGEVFGVWRDNFQAMAEKTVVKKVCKLLPKSTELAIALAVDEGVRVDVSPDIDAAEVTRHIPGDVEPSDGDDAPATGGQNLPDEAPWPTDAEPGE